MFSQFRQAVESLAQPLPQDNALPAVARSQSPDPLRHSGSTRKPRSASPSSAKTTSDVGLRKTTLEERLRASFAVSDSSGLTTPNTPSTRASPVPRPIPVTQHPLSPTSTPLPDSPALPEFSETDQASQGPNDAPEPPGVTPPTGSPDLTDTVHVDSMAAHCVDLTPQETDAVLLQRDVSEPEEDSDSPVSANPEPDGQRDSAGVEALQERLKLVEQRFADVSTSFKKLQAERQDIDNAISELTPLSGSKDVEALREYLNNTNVKIELGHDELQRLSGKLTRQEERLGELRDTHKLETASQLNQIERLREQLSEAEALVTASQSTASQTEEANAKRDSDIDQLRAEVAKANETAKEEEEKRVKAISLLKTVRQKLVKAEKERDDALRELTETKDRNLHEKEKDLAERANLEREIDVANAEREKALTGLRAQFDKDISVAKDRAERDIQTAKRQFDAEVNTLKASYNEETSAKKLRISTLENTVTNLTNENKSFFEQMELRQAELESSQCHAESVQAQNTELQFQLKEVQERITLLNDEVTELRGEHEMRLQGPSTSAEEISQLVSSIEVKYEAKLSELKKTLTTAEKERTGAEASWSNKLTEKTKETEELKRMLQSSAQLREQDEDMTGSLRGEIEKLQTEARSQHSRLHELQSHIDSFKDAEATLHRRLLEAAARAEDSEKQLHESTSREAQLRTQNKTLRDELRKVQNSAAILERQRNPGAGYWASRSEVTDSRSSVSSIPDGASSTSPPQTKNEEDINHEYLRNVILQFLEHKEMRPNLVRVLSTILRFTPQETRRLMSKV